ncbi:hypothetical protein U14_04327 [Candidatus Moduliflexus flocculans]|uniref:Endonuclease GajA/Old nuclease/RecF-like AAA domain-containing protein n=1 Tax=Candidatus Moduliflexus flocculans TaxID=1499966 RepID=A0A0S6W3Z9_9BACT|nr:hypothetical protein U14_04327 [Candidatus Moduliflexus flocculans]
MERLIIKNFVGIESLEIELRKFNILIGPQATGKSVVAKLLFYFKNFIWDIFTSLENEQTKQDFDHRFIEKFIEYFPSESWGNGNFSIRYEIRGKFIEINYEGSKPKLRLNYSDYFQRQIRSYRQLLKKISDNRLGDKAYNQFDDISKLRQRFLGEAVNQLGDVVGFSQLFIPAGRSFFANLQNNIFAFLSTDNAIEPFLREFGVIYENIKRLSPFNESEHLEIRQSIESLLFGKYIRERSKDYLLLADGRKIHIANSSSGQQEILPLTLILNELPFLYGGQTVYIEEPEAHLFPTTQKDVIELIAAVFNLYGQNPLQFIITTHSPYIITAMNNLLYAGKLYETLPEEQCARLKEIIPRSRSLKLQDIAAYSLEHGGGKSIVCEEIGLIESQIIDAVSDQLAMQFDLLLQVE